ncbi:uncharacterized protein [Acropora muricata]|uniref:uncharacterized protein isoform X2 n=1 Tax=Acropora muricata TaxID=159855 RepID=UPI0034E51DBF
MSRSPSPSSSSESYYGYSEESEPESFPEKPLLEIGGYDDSVEPVPTEEEAAEYLEQLALEEEEEQTLLSRFSGEEDIRDWPISLEEEKEDSNEQKRKFQRMERPGLLCNKGKLTSPYLISFW